MRERSWREWSGRSVGELLDHKEQLDKSVLLGIIILVQRISYQFCGKFTKQKRTGGGLNK